MTEVLKSPRNSKNKEIIEVAEEPEEEEEHEQIGMEHIPNEGQFPTEDVTPRSRGSR